MVDASFNCFKHLYKNQEFDSYPKFWSTLFIGFKLESEKHFR